jgi:methylmalonyl-CoA/ethylmalonyl-CoA epimerase
MTTPSASGVPLLNATGGVAAQVGILVADIDTAMAAYGPTQAWRIWTFRPEMLEGPTFRGEPAEYVFRAALNGTTPQLELIEHISGAGIYDEWLADHDYGLHHLGFYVDDLVAATEEMEQAGFETIQFGLGTGADGSGGYAYFDTMEALGYLVEAIMKPIERRPPESVWPPEQ